MPLIHFNSPHADRSPRGCNAGNTQAKLPLQQFDVLLGADLLYTRSYARKVATVATQLLKPGGVLVLTTPRARAGYGKCDPCSPMARRFE